MKLFKVVALTAVLIMVGALLVLRMPVYLRVIPARRII